MPGPPGGASSGKVADDQVQKAVSDTISVLSDKKVQFTWSEMLAGTVSRLPSAPGLFEQARAGIEGAIEGQRLIPLDREKGIFTSDIHLLNELSVHQLARTAIQNRPFWSFLNGQKSVICLPGMLSLCCHRIKALWPFSAVAEARRPCVSARKMCP